jgi:hypothetical protein
MGVPAFEVVLDHNDPKHHDRMAGMLRDLQAWAARHGVRHVKREMQEIRPGVTRLRFTPDARGGAAAPARDSLALSPARPRPAMRRATGARPLPSR